jgi:hypothetical protein
MASASSGLTCLTALISSFNRSSSARFVPPRSTLVSHGIIADDSMVTSISSHWKSCPPPGVTGFANGLRAH